MVRNGKDQDSRLPQKAGQADVRYSQSTCRIPGQGTNRRQGRMEALRQVADEVSWAGALRVGVLRQGAFRREMRAGNGERRRVRGDEVIWGRMRGFWRGRARTGSRVPRRW